MADVSALLNKVISLMEKDVEAIERLSKHGDKLEHLVAQDLVRYSSALLDLNQVLEAKDREHKSKLSKMSTEELTKLAKDIIEGKS